jgi:hypothetical protein
VLRRRLSPHILEKLLKRSAHRWIPAIANLDSSAAISGITDGFRIVTTLNHVLPRTVFGCAT